MGRIVILDRVEYEYRDAEYEHELAIRRSFGVEKNRGCLETGDFLSEPVSRRSSPWSIEERIGE
jgi:hypothetical protein